MSNFLTLLMTTIASIYADSSMVYEKDIAKAEKSYQNFFVAEVKGFTRSEFSLTDAYGLNTNKAIYRKPNGSTVTVAILAKGADQSKDMFKSIFSLTKMTFENRATFKNQTFIKVGSQEIAFYQKKDGEFSASAILPSERALQITHESGVMTKEEFSDFLNALNYSVL